MPGNEALGCIAPADDVDDRGGEVLLCFAGDVDVETAFADGGSQTRPGDGGHHRQTLFAGGALPAFVRKDAGQHQQHVIEARQSGLGEREVRHGRRIECSREYPDGSGSAGHGQDQFQFVIIRILELSLYAVGIRTEVGMADVSPLTDEELFRRSNKGDEDAFTTLYRRRQPSVYRFALHMSGRQEVAEEVTQEVFLTLIREPDRFDCERGALSAFLIGVARNFVLRHIERDRRHVYMDEESNFDPEAEGPDLLSELSREQAVEAVRQAVLTLPATYREAVVLCDLEEMSYAGAADVLAVPVGTVRSRLNRGRGLLLDKLKAMRASAGCSA